MLPGYNTNVKHQGSSYHIQTEDGGAASPHIVTIVYRGGAIVAQKKSDYRHLLSSDNYEKQLRQLIQNQHRHVMNQLLSGELENGPVEDSIGQPPVEETPAEKEKPALDRAIMQFLSEAEEQP